MKSNLLESAFRSSAVVGFLLLYSSQFLPQGLSFQNAFLYNFTELQRTFFSSKVLFGSFVGNFPKGSKKLANLNGLCKQSFLQNTVWTVNDVLVDPYPFNAVKSVWIDQKKREWIDQDIIDSPHCIL